MPAARRIARTSTTGAMSGAASGLAPICRAMSASVIASSRFQSVRARALDARSLKVLSISLDLSPVGFSQRDHPSHTAAISMDAHEETSLDAAESSLANLSIVEPIVQHRHAWAGEQHFGQRQGHAMFLTVRRVLGGVEVMVHRRKTTPPT